MESWDPDPNNLVSEPSILRAMANKKGCAGASNARTTNFERNLQSLRDELTAQVVAEQDAVASIQRSVAELQRTVATVGAEMRLLLLETRPKAPDPVGNVTPVVDPAPISLGSLPETVGGKTLTGVAAAASTSVPKNQSQWVRPPQVVLFNGRSVMDAKARVYKKTRTPPLHSGVGCYLRPKLHGKRRMWVMKANPGVFFPEFDEALCHLSMGPTSLPHTSPQTATNPSSSPVFNVSEQQEVYLSVAVPEEAGFTSSECKRDDVVVRNGTAQSVALASAPVLDPKLVSLNADPTTPKVPAVDGVVCLLETPPDSNPVLIMPEKPNFDIDLCEEDSIFVGNTKLFVTGYANMVKSLNYKGSYAPPEPILHSHCPTHGENEVSKGREADLDQVWDDSGGFPTMKIKFNCLCTRGLVLAACALIHSAAYMVEDHPQTVIVPEFPQLLLVVEHLSQVRILNSLLKAVWFCRNFIEPVASRLFGTNGFRLTSSISCVIAGDIEQATVQFAAATYEIEHFDSILSPLWEHTTTPSGLPAVHKHLFLNVADTQVIAICLSALEEISSSAINNFQAILLESDNMVSKIVLYSLLNRTREFKEWAQCPVVELEAPFITSSLKVLVPIAIGTEESAAIVIVDILQRAKATVVMATEAEIGNLLIHGSHFWICDTKKPIVFHWDTFSEVGVRNRTSVPRGFIVLKFNSPDIRRAFQNITSGMLILNRYRLKDKVGDEDYPAAEWIEGLIMAADNLFPYRSTKKFQVDNFLFAIKLAYDIGSGDITQLGSLDMVHKRKTKLQLVIALSSINVLLPKLCGLEPAVKTQAPMVFWVPCCLLLWVCKMEVPTLVGTLNTWSHGHMFCFPLEHKFEKLSLSLADTVEKMGQNMLLNISTVVMFVSKGTDFVALGSIYGETYVDAVKQMEHELTKLCSGIPFQGVLFFLEVTSELAFAKYTAGVILLVDLRGVGNTSVITALQRTFFLCEVTLTCLGKSQDAKILLSSGFNETLQVNAELSSMRQSSNPIPLLSPSDTHSELQFIFQACIVMIHAHERGLTKSTILPDSPSFWLWLPTTLYFQVWVPHLLVLIGMMTKLLVGDAFWIREIVFATACLIVSTEAMVHRLVCLLSGQLHLIISTTHICHYIMCWLHIDVILETTCSLAHFKVAFGSGLTILLPNVNKDVSRHAAIDQLAILSTQYQSCGYWYGAAGVACLSHLDW